VAVRRIAGIAGLTALVGQPLGTSDWFPVDQGRIDAFADATLDRYWIHIDRERATRESPFGRTVAHGFLTLSLIPHLHALVYKIDGLAMMLNYGLGRVRFPAPLPEGIAIRAAFRLASVEPRQPGQALVTVEATVEAEAVERPVCVAETMTLVIE